MFIPVCHTVKYFGGNSSHTEGIFRIQKRTARVIMGSGRRDSCRQLFRHSNILPLYSQYIFSLLLFIIKNRRQFLSNSKAGNTSTRYNSDLHLPSANLTLYQKGVFMQELSFITTCNQLSRMGNGLKQHQGDIFWIIPSTDWRNILIEIHHDLDCCHTIINMMTVEL
jgi:hypothetical protein